MPMTGVVSSSYGADTILVVEDDARTRRAITAMLQGLGFQVLTAKDGNGGLAAAEHERPDIVLTDIIMPEMEGLGLIRALRRSQPKIKIIAMSVSDRGGDSDYLSMARKLGADATLAKPFTRTELMAAITAIKQASPETA